MAKIKREHQTKDGIGVAVQKLAQRMSWTHGMIAQLVRASERNLVFVASNPTP